MLNLSISINCIPQSLWITDFFFSLEYPNMMKHGDHTQFGILPKIIISLFLRKFGLYRDGFYRNKNLQFIQTNEGWGRFHSLSIELFHRNVMGIHLDRRGVHCTVYLVHFESHFVQLISFYITINSKVFYELLQAATNLLTKESHSILLSFECYEKRMSLNSILHPTLFKLQKKPISQFDLMRLTSNLHVNLMIY